MEGLFWGLPGTMKVPQRNHVEGNPSDLRPAERGPPPAPLKGPFVPGPTGTSAWTVLAFTDTGCRPMGPLVPIHRQEGGKTRRYFLRNR